MKRNQCREWTVGTLRTLGAAAGVALLSVGAAPAALAAGERLETMEEQAIQASAQAGSNVTLI